MSMENVLCDLINTAYIANKWDYAGFFCISKLSCTQVDRTLGVNISDWQKLTSLWKAAA